MVQHVIDAAKELGAFPPYIWCTGTAAICFARRCTKITSTGSCRPKQLGTGHAMQQAAPFFSDDEDILMLYGDVPLHFRRNIEASAGSETAGRHRSVDGEA
ncbi:N-acetylglucosamine-1-phosphate uridyltransferase [Klebsiella michiganensis]|uniref:N-acetylglucosamine-1-phosphate uridyltransferase n=1 Tax=Klebsiella michiganensis TaxID=1134687 RepID=A0A7H4PET0_9ENTR|nr:N-acetylglucosamine-1-phosphate uridyltransferase [Klebsiella michiganensis]